ncbi:nuclear transport factor 2 family protein [Sphingobium sp. EM0848]|uniref:nuclear transport factor 2 family protein n=1 Tax=Sphingobium sp. EM0848 TaxID=2743473 RepID=UPI00159C86C5|nr:nuclear transport factor 2 family protein [Sphingobium sp. EM0848]
MAHEIIIEAADQHFRAENSLDLEGVGSTFHPSATFALQTFTLHISSMETIMELHRRMFALFPQRVSEPRKTHEWYKKGGLSAEWEYTLTQASGTRVRAKRVTIFEFLDGLIISKRLFMDGAYSDLLREALGSDVLALPGVEKLGK